MYTANGFLSSEHGCILLDFAEKTGCQAANYVLTKTMDAKRLLATATQVVSLKPFGVRNNRPE